MTRPPLVGRSAPGAILLACALSASSPVYAQTNSEAAAAVTRANAAFGERRFGEARIAYEEAVRLEPTPQRLFALAQACRNTSRYLRAIEVFERYLAAPEPDALPARLDVVRSQVAEMRRLLGSLTLHVTPTGGRVLLDGRALTGPIEHAPIDPGPHIIETSADGHRPDRREITVEASAQIVLDVALVAVAVEGPHLVVEPSVASASVTIDGQPAGVGRIERTLTPGDHAIEIQASGYEPFRRSVHLNTTGTTRMDASLLRRGLPGWVLPTAITGGVVVVAGTILGVWLATRDTGPDLHPAWGPPVTEP